MKSLKLFLLTAMAVSVCAPIQAKPAKAAKSNQTWWQRNKKRVAKGVALAAAIGATIGLAYHGNKTKKAVEAAGLTSDSPEYGDAVAAVGLLGPLGMQRTINLIAEGLKQNIIDAQFAAYLVFSKVGAALSNYFGVSHAKFIKEAGVVGIKKAVQEAREAIKEGWNTFSNWVTGNK